MIETVKINWLLLLSPLLWALGIAAAFTLLAMWFFEKRTSGTGFRVFFTSLQVKNWLKVSTALVITGLLLGFFKLPSSRLIAVKVDNPGNKEFKPVTLQGVHFLPSHLEINAKNKNHVLNNEKMRDNTMVLLWDGYIRSPFLRYPLGDYSFEFEAKGSRAKGEFSALKIELEAPDQNGFLSNRYIWYTALTAKMKTYRLPFPIRDTGVITARIRLTYFNDLYVPETKQGRDVWIKNIRILRHK